ncbi:MAG: glucoamylase family protein [Pseudomonadota bacterium]
MIIAAIPLVLLALSLFLSGYFMDAVATTRPHFSEPVIKRLVLHDFNRRDLLSNVGGESGAWTGHSDLSTGKVDIALSGDERRGESGHALHLSYSLDRQAQSSTGFRIGLNGLDGVEYDHLEFWVKGDPGKGYARSFKVAFQRPFNACLKLSERGSYVVTEIDNEWKRVSIPLNLMNGITDWTDLDEMVITLQSRRSNVKQGAYYVDDIALIKTGMPGPHIWDKVIPQHKKSWERSVGGQQAARPHIHARLSGWPSSLLVDRKKLPEDRQDFLWRLARDTWRGLDALTDREHGLPLDTVAFHGGQLDPQRVYIGDYTNITNIAMYLLATVAASDLGFLPREQAMERLNTTLSSLEKLETFQGFYFNYYDTTTLERTSNFISFVDSSWLTAGLMVVRTAFPELHQRSTRLIDQTDYDWLYDDVEQLMSHGYYVNLHYPSEYHYGLLYTESRMGSLIAIGKGDVPEQHWFKMERTFPSDYAWQTLPPQERKIKRIRGNELMGGYYQWRDFKYIPSWGGSLFEALMPTLVVDEKKFAPKSLGKNNETHAIIHRRYATEELNYPVWGMSPSSAVARDSYSEYGVKFLGARGYKCGVITPHASALALSTTPEAAVSNLHRLATLYDIYGEFGFYDAVDPLSGEVTYKYLALNQGMLFISLANYLKDQSIQRYFAADPIAAKALAVIGEEKFFD